MNQTDIKYIKHPVSLQKVLRGDQHSGKLLTATPMKNNPNELVDLLNLVIPNRTENKNQNDNLNIFTYKKIIH